ncbi:hypothetical protein MTR_6g060705 [Medicago truncatula]|uniref:Uncharacterized protein n=1 Tax=Medicago truncatula TaxID=3880 RepID=A0A072U9J9_MEDTR|nr:hypothetical protein MTR_6g060705 [Medicago truncatula]
MSFFKENGKRRRLICTKNRNNNLISVRIHTAIVDLRQPLHGVVRRPPPSHLKSGLTTFAFAPLNSKLFHFPLFIQFYLRCS